MSGHTANFLDNILAKLDGKLPIDLIDAAYLLNNADNIYIQKIVLSASMKYRRYYCNDVGFIVPIYFDTRCQNNCKYCGMASSNTVISRGKNNYKTFLEELDILGELGYNTIELVAGSVSYDLNLLRKMMSAIRAKGKSAAFCLDSLSTDEYKQFATEKDTMIHFQETYNQDIYKKIHPLNTKKGNYNYRIDAVERAILAGLKKVGLGILFGLNKFIEDVLMVIDHGKYLELKYNLKIKLIGIPRLQITAGCMSDFKGFEVSNQELLLAAALYRLAFPYAEMVATTREDNNMIGDLLSHAATYTNFCCSLTPGGYKELKFGTFIDSQFQYHSPGYENIINIIESNKLVPNFKKSF